MENIKLDVIINETVEELKKSDFIKNVVETNVKKAVQGSIEGAFKYGSPLKKAIEEGINASVGVAVKSITFPEYSHQICNWIKQELDNSFELEAKKSIKENLDKFFKPLKKESYNLSEIVDDFKEWIEQTESDETIALFVDKSTGCLDKYFNVYMDKDSSTSKYSCEIQFGCSEDGIHSLEVDDTKLEGSKIATFVQNTAKLLYKIMVAKIPVINDIEDVDDHNYLEQWEN